jgi:DUF917 family protein
MRAITHEQLDDIAKGAAVLGTGGGGDPYIGKLLAQQALKTHGPVTMIDVTEVEDEGLYAGSAMMGAPTVMVEKLPRGEEVVNAFQRLQEFLGRPLAGTFSAEAGGLNSTIPFVVAATLGIPLVDVDMMGRAFPELQMVTPTMYGISATPLAIADEKGNSSILNTIDNRWTETFARTLTIDMGCSAMIALYPMTGKQLRETAVPGTISLDETIGRTIREAHAAHIDPIEAVRGAVEGMVIWRGKVADIARRTETGFARGTATIAGTGDYAGRDLLVDFQNEFLIARDSAGQVLVTTPDLITMLDGETGEPITTEALRYGFRVAVLALKCDWRWRSNAGLDLVGPAYFGYDADYVPVEDRIPKYRAVNGGSA